MPIGRTPSSANPLASANFYLFGALGKNSHISSGEGVMTLGREQFRVQKGDTLCIPPGTPHCIEAVGSASLVLLCCCSPAYDPADTQLLSEAI